jgi:mRNA-degrading endonuclease RelE of RelBE toxin-antitoxin system
MVKLTKPADKQLRRLPRDLLGRVEDTLRRLGEDPRSGKMLVGRLKGKRSIRVGRSYRIVYEIVATDVIVMSVLPRKDAYR